MHRLASFRLLVLLLLAGTLSACDTNDGDSLGASAYFGTYTGTIAGTANAGGFPLPVSLPGTATFTKTGTDAVSLTVGSGASTATLVGTYDERGMRLAGEQGVRVTIDQNGKVDGTLALTLNGVSASFVASGTITRARLKMQLTTAAGSPVAATLAFDGTK